MGLDGDLAVLAAVATAQVETPRIITPSRTAWPPTGASRCSGLLLTYE